jgi:hypothetical protein
MSRRKEGAPDMFDVLERQERTAHFPAPTDYPACSRFYAGIIDRYDSAMMKADTAAAVDIKEECNLFREHVYEALQDEHSVCRADISGQLSKANRAPDGTVPQWGQEGTFTITVCSVPVRIEVDHLCGIGMYGENLLPHFSIHIVDKHRSFLSHTGYRSFFLNMHDTEPGVTLADAIGRILREYVQREMKGKLERYDPYKGYTPAHRRARMIADGMAAEDAEQEAEPTEEETPVEDDDLACDGCGDSLTLVDEFTETECGTFCAPCFLAHSRDCAGCKLDLIEDHGGVHPAPTRSGGALLPPHAAIARFSASSDDGDHTTPEPVEEADQTTAAASGAQISLF